MLPAPAKLEQKQVARCRADVFGNGFTQLVRQRFRKRRLRPCGYDPAFCRGFQARRSQSLGAKTLTRSELARFGARDFLACSPGMRKSFTMPPPSTVLLNSGTPPPSWALTRSVMSCSRSGFLQVRLCCSPYSAIASL